MTWHRIDDPENPAPKDGTIIIVPGGIAHWYGGEWRSLTAMDYPGRKIEWQVKHWMRFPNPPEKERT